MKRTFLILLALSIATVAFAFPAGTMNIGGDVSFMVGKNDYSILTVSPVFGYLINPNLSIDIDLEYKSDTSGYYRMKDLAVGGGARYFKDVGFGKLYGGGGLLLSYYKYGKNGKWDHSYTLANLKAGYLLPMTDCLYLDLGINYKADTEYLDDPLYEARLGLQFFTKSLIPKARQSSPSYDYDYDYDYDY